MENPIHSPTEFRSILPKCSQHLSSTTARNTAKRIVTNEERLKSSETTAKDADMIKSWKTLITYCSSLDLIFTSNNTSIRLSKLPDSFPPDVLFSVQIDSSFNLKAYLISPNHQNCFYSWIPNLQEIDKKKSKKPRMLETNSYCTYLPSETLMYRYVWSLEEFP